MLHKKILITGATSALGQSIAKRCSTILCGNVVLLGLNAEKLKQLSKETGFKSIVCDIRNPEDCKKAHEIVGDIDIIINCNTVWYQDCVEATDADRRNKIFSTNAMGTINIVEEWLPDFIAENNGTIVTVTPKRDMSCACHELVWKDYSAASAALCNYIDSARTELAHTNIKITHIASCGINCKMFKTSGNLDTDNESLILNTDDVTDMVIFAITRPDDVAITSLVIEKIGTKG